MKLSLLFCILALAIPCCASVVDRDLALWDGTLTPVLAVHARPDDLLYAGRHEEDATPNLSYADLVIGHQELRTLGPPESADGAGLAINPDLDAFTAMIYALGAGSALFVAYMTGYRK